jgi:hypothetical protein
VERVNDVNYRVNVGSRRGIVTYHINQEDHQLRLEYIFPNDQSETLQDIVINNQFTSVQKSQLKDICQANKDIFTTIPGKCKIATHSIRTNIETPISQRPYHIPVAKREVVKQQLDDMLRQGLITPSKSAWSAPIVLVAKPDNSIRICIDYRRLNAISVSDNYPIPRISEVFEKIGSAKYLTQFDLTKGYYQIPLSEDTKDKSVFMTPYGLFQFEVMPFEMKTSPATFARLMDHEMNEYPHAVAYFDDIVIFSDTWDERLDHIKDVLDRIKATGLTIRPSKCKLRTFEIVCLGHIIGSGKIRPDPKKIAAMIEFPLPLTKKDLRSFLGLTGYYRQYIMEYAKITAR